MDKRVIFAVAGSGKTTFLINQLNETERFLLVSYTNNNVHNLRTGIIKNLATSQVILSYTPITLFFMAFATSRFYTTN